MTRATRGFTLVELMVAVTISLFLTGGLLTLVQAMKATAVTQSAMSQLQDNERMAMTLIADVIQSAGYFPNPAVNTAALLMPNTAPYTFAGQSLVGSGSGAAPAPGDTLSVRYVTGGTNAPNNDYTINCFGATSTTQTVYSNTFSLQADPNGGWDLVCSLNGAAPVVLVPGISNLQIYYGVQTNPTVSNNSVDTYLDATAVTNWNNVMSVKITLTFINPMYGRLPGQTMNTQQIIPFTRVIDVMSKGGITS